MSNKKLKAFEAKAEQAVRESVLVPSEISYLLYQADVLNTGCQQNEGMENEYDHLAQWIYDDLVAGESLQNAVMKNVADLFDEKVASANGHQHLERVPYSAYCGKLVNCLPQFDRDRHQPCQISTQSDCGGALHSKQVAQAVCGFEANYSLQRGLFFLPACFRLCRVISNIR